MGTQAVLPYSTLRIIPQRRYLFTKLHGVTLEKAVKFIVTLTDNSYFPRVRLHLLLITSCMEYSPFKKPNISSPKQETPLTE